MDSGVELGCVVSMLLYLGGRFPKGEVSLNTYCRFDCVGAREIGEREGRLKA